MDHHIDELKEKAENWDSHKITCKSWSENSVNAYQKLQQENKQLKAQIENIENANDMWKERAKGFVEIANEKADLMVQNEELNEIVQKVREQLIVLDNVIAHEGNIPDSIKLMDRIKEILGK